MNGVLNESQLSWCRLNLPHFRDMERKARAAIRDTEASYARHPATRAKMELEQLMAEQPVDDLQQLAEIDCAPRDLGRK